MSLDKHFSLGKDVHINGLRGKVWSVNANNNLLVVKFDERDMPSASKAAEYNQKHFGYNEEKSADELVAWCKTFLGKNKRDKNDE